MPPAPKHRDRLARIGHELLHRCLHQRQIVRMRVFQSVATDQFLGSITFDRRHRRTRVENFISGIDQHDPIAAVFKKSTEPALAVVQRLGFAVHLAPHIFEGAGQHPDFTGRRYFFRRSLADGKRLHRAGQGHQWLGQ